MLFINREAQTRFCHCREFCWSVWWVHKELIRRDWCPYKFKGFTGTQHFRESEIPVIFENERNKESWVFIVNQLWRGLYCFFLWSQQKWSYWKSSTCFLALYSMLNIIEPPIAPSLGLYSFISKLAKENC